MHNLTGYATKEVRKLESLRYTSVIQIKAIGDHLPSTPVHGEKRQGTRNRRLSLHLAMLVAMLYPQQSPVAAQPAPLHTCDTGIDVGFVSLLSFS